MEIELLKKQQQATDIQNKARMDVSSAAEFDKKYEYAMGESSRLGSGSFADVVLARRKHPCEGESKEVAVKMLLAEKWSDEAAEAAKQEAWLLKELRCPSILKVFDWYKQESEYRFLIVMEKADSSLHNFVLKRREPLTEQFIKILMRALLIALKTSHNRRIHHGDIKPENILIVNRQNQPDIPNVNVGERDALNVEITDYKDDPVQPLPGTKQYLVLSDFGSAFQYSKDDIQRAEVKHILGTVLFFPPERLSGKVKARASDIYSAGMVMFFLLTGGQFPYAQDVNSIPPTEEVNEIYINLVATSFDLNLVEIMAWKNASDAARNLVSKMLNKNEDLRGEAVDLLKDEFFTGKPPKTSKIEVSPMKKYSERSNGRERLNDASRDGMREKEKDNMKVSESSRMVIANFSTKHAFDLAQGAPPLEDDGKFRDLALKKRDI